ncbi:hypothetical protein [Microbulbifer sp. YPW16]|uniref:hypothetical protein n=1 Tax=Microbulbifer sp. YPW16 TaxID=2904242 RepID=UPI001E4E957A|nr:hypothetical protein [Microbulbifer sp. YPW16]UHQ55340.1 hypothetical protein LVE68_17815 [Microbulbifer sp. YPW16]
MKITSIYFYYYCYLRRFFKNGPSGWLYESKAIITLCFLEAIILIGLTAYLFASLDIGVNFSFHPALVIVPSSFALYGINHWILLSGNRWKRYDEALNMATRKFQERGRALAILATISFPAAFIFVLWQVGRMKGTW